MRQLSTPILAALLLAIPNHVDAREPSVDEVRRAALQHADLDGRPNRWAARARLRHLLPEITVDAARIDQTDLSAQFDEWLTRDGDAVLLYDAAKNRNENSRRRRADFSIRASVDLGGLVFEADELAASREARARLDAQLQLTTRIHDAYFERLAALDELRTISVSDVTRRRTATLRVQMLEATLDAMTGGWFGRELRRSP